MDLDTDISDGVAKMRAATLLGEIVRLHQCTKNLLKYVQKNQSMGILLQYQLLTHRNFSSSARDKDWVEDIILHYSGGKEGNKVAMAQYLSKYFFKKYEDEAIFSASKCGFSVRTSVKP